MKKIETLKDVCDVLESAEYIPDGHSVRFNGKVELMVDEEFDDTIPGRLLFMDQEIWKQLVAIVQAHCE